MKDSRRARLAELFQKRYGGDRARFTKASGLTKGRVTQLFDEDEPFGEIAARRLAERLGVSPDYFERSDQLGAPSIEPAPPGPEFADRQTLSDSDWAAFMDYREAMSVPRLARKLNEIRSEVDELREYARRQGSPAIAAAKAKAQGKPKQREPGESNFGSLAGLPESSSSKRKAER